MEVGGGRLGQQQGFAGNQVGGRCIRFGYSLHQVMIARVPTLSSRRKVRAEGRRRWETLGTIIAGESIEGQFSSIYLRSVLRRVRQKLAEWA